jgi:hypothetical protein
MIRSEGVRLAVVQMELRRTTGATDQRPGSDHRSVVELLVLSGPRAMVHGADAANVLDRRPQFEPVGLATGGADALSAWP